MIPSTTNDEAQVNHELAQCAGLQIFEETVETKLSTYGES